MQKFILHKDIIESASSGLNMDMSEDQTCLKLMEAIDMKDHKLVVSRSVRKKYLDAYKSLVVSKTPINPIMPLFLPLIFTNSSKIIDLRDSLQRDPAFDECENIIINLALDDRQSTIVTQNEEFIRRVNTIHEIQTTNPIQALTLAISD